jgi:hypothetical protein
MRSGLGFVHDPTRPVLDSADYGWACWLACRPVPARRTDANTHADQDAGCAGSGNQHPATGTHAPAQRDLHPFSVAFSDERPSQPQPPRGG